VYYLHSNNLFISLQWWIVTSKLSLPLCITEMEVQLHALNLETECSSFTFLPALLPLRRNHWYPCDRICRTHSVPGRGVEETITAVAVRNRILFVQHTHTTSLHCPKYWVAFNEGYWLEFKSFNHSCLLHSERFYSQHFTTTIIQARLPVLFRHTSSPYIKKVVLKHPF
jgi:hypothetical protein